MSYFQPQIERISVKKIIIIVVVVTGVAIIIIIPYFIRFYIHWYILASWIWIYSWRLIILEFFLP